MARIANVLFELGVSRLANRTHHSGSTQPLSTIQKDLPQAAEESGVGCNSMRAYCRIAKMQGHESSLSSLMSGKQSSKADVCIQMANVFPFLSKLFEGEELC